MAPPTLLSTDLLDEYLERAAAAGVRHVDHLQPGLSDAHMDRILKIAEMDMDVAMPTEGRVLWGWRNGIPPFAPWWDVARGSRLLSLEEAVTAYHRSRASGYQLQNEEPGFELERDFWPKRFLPFLDRQNLVAMDTASAPGAPSAVHQLEIYDHRADAIATPDLPSIGTLVQWWIEALDDGIWRWDATHDRWDYTNQEMIPHDRRFYL